MVYTTSTNLPLILLPTDTIGYLSPTWNSNWKPWYLYQMVTHKLQVRALKEQSLLSDLFKTCFIRQRAVTKRLFSSKRPILLHACATCTELPSHFSTMDQPEYQNIVKIYIGSSIDSKSAKDFLLMFFVTFLSSYDSELFT